MSRCVPALVVLSAFLVANSQAGVASRKHNAKVPVTTSSPVARKHFQKAMENLEQVRLDDVTDELRSATKADPRFAQGWILLAHFSRNPDEQQLARAHAIETKKHATVGEQLLVAWFANAQEGNYVPAIAAMNDLLAKYPHDYELATLAGGWLMRQQRYEQSVALLEKALTAAPNDAAAYNELGYAYAELRDYPKATAAMERYVALMPEEPNPYDSYGEILRMAGKFDAALDQYRKSIHIDPNFGSELGVADTYALMGKEEEARDEYARAIVFARSETEKVEYELNSAMTWIRENDHRQAERAIRAAARHAHAAGLGQLEADSHRILGLYEPDYKAAVKEFDAANRILGEPHQMTRADYDDEQARILLARALRAANAKRVDDASSAVTGLEQMAEHNRSQTVQLAYHTAQGGLFLAQQNYSDAISQLEEDADDPLALRLLWQAYNGAGQLKQAGDAAAKLASLNEPTPEQALVVPQFRVTLTSQAEGSAQ